MDHLLIPLLSGTLVAATPLIFAALGNSWPNAPAC